MAKNNNNATCIICGKGYHLCIACERTNLNWKQWRMIADTENCYNIYNVINDYNFNKISKDKACGLLKNLDLKELSTLKESVKATINEIMNVKSVETKEVETDDIAEEIVAEEIVEKKTTKKKSN